MISQDKPRLCKLKAVFDKHRDAVISLTCPDDTSRTEFLLTPQEFPGFDAEDSKWLGHVYGKARRSGDNFSFTTGLARKDAEIREGNGSIIMSYSKLRDNQGEPVPLSLTSQLHISETQLDWRFTLRNTGEKPVEILELDIPLPMDQYFRKDDFYKYEQCVMRHSCIVGASSYVYWSKSSGNGPVLLMAAVDGTRLEAFREDRNTAIHHLDEVPGAFGGLYCVCPIGKAVEHPQGKTSSLTLEIGGEKNFSFRFAFLPGEGDINPILAQWGLLAMEPVPGMVLPKPETAKLLVYGGGEDLDITPAHTNDKVLSVEQKDGAWVATVQFSEYGLRDVDFVTGGHKTTYTFFVTEEPRAMIDSHAQFVVEHHRETDPSDPCYHGFLMWDMVNKRRINSSFNPYSEDWWRGGSDEIGLVGGLFLSEKNVYRPVEEELHALDDYVNDFLLSRLTEQPGWRVHRMVPWHTMFEPWAGNGADDVWRAYNYVHVVNTLYNMYRIQKVYKFPFLKERNEYLKLCYHYTMAMFCYWMFPDGVGATEYGNMGEMTFPLYLPQSLKEEGFEQEAAWLEGIFTKKEAYFASRQFPYGSEMAYDSTAYEAVYGYGKSVEDDRVMEAAAKASFANRGKQPVWYLFNTDMRGGGDTGWNVSYMTQLGAFPIWDYAVNLGKQGTDWLLSAYGAYYAGWIIYNSGGYWSPAPENQGATGWIIQGGAGRMTGQPVPGGFPMMNGLVALSGEAELGFFGALRMASSLLFRHSVLGLTGLGCKIEQVAGGITAVTPEDGLSMRFVNMAEGWRLELDRDKIEKLMFFPGKTVLTLKNYTGDAHTATLTLTRIADQFQRTIPVQISGEKVEVELPV